MASLSSYFFRFLMQNAGIFNRSDLTIAEQRERIERGIRFLKAPGWVTIKQVDAGGVPAEWDIPEGTGQERVILYIHGGAWTICSPRTHRPMVSYLARAAGARALSIDYRMAPEHPFPAALEDCLAAYRWLLKEGISPQQIVIAGDSAGGNLTLAALLALRDAGDPLPAGAVCLSPATDLTGGGETRQTRAKREVVLRRVTHSKVNVVNLYAAGHDVHDPYLSPIFGDLHGLPPILIHVGNDEILLDDSTRFVERACMAGVDAKVVVWPAMWHVFQMHVPTMPEARESIRQLGEFIRRVTPA